MTIHSSKGLQADYVFLLNNKAYGMGFPSQIADAPVLQLLLDNCDHYPFAEERRLFYVGNLLLFFPRRYHIDKKTIYVPETFLYQNGICPILPLNMCKPVNIFMLTVMLL